MDETLDPNDPNAIRAQILASLQQRMAPVAPVDTSAQEAAAKAAMDQSNVLRSGVSLGQAFLGKQTKGDNLWSDSLEDGAKTDLAKVLEAKRVAAEQDKRREELRNGLSTRFVDDENLKVRDAEARKGKEADHERDRKEKEADQKALFEQQLKLANMNNQTKKEVVAAKGSGPANDEKSQQKLSKELQSPQVLDSALRDIEEKLGGPLSSFTFGKNGELLQGGKERDLPGVNLPGIGNLSFYSGDARELDGAMSAVFNMTLKDRSGAAVTDNELDRLKKEFNDGRYNTEPQKVKALQAYQRRVQEVMANREAGYNEDVVNEYSDRGGRTSRDVNPVSRNVGSSAAPVSVDAKKARLEELRAKKAAAGK